MRDNVELEKLRELSDAKITSDYGKRDLTALFLNQLSTISLRNSAKIMSLFKNTMLNHENRSYYTAFVDINNQCNLSCPNCINSCFNNNTEDLTWSLEKMNNVFFTIKQNTKMIFIPGGEPFMNPNLIDAIEQNQDMLFLVFTNGTMSEEYKKLIDKKLRNIVVIFSIDGTKDYHDNKRGTGVYDLALKNLQYLRDKKYPCTISSVVDSKNIDHLFSSEYIEFVKKAKANGLLFLKDAKDNSDEFMEKYYNKSQELAQNLGKTFPIFNMPYMEHQVKLNNGLCVGGKLFIHINAYGEITRCPFDLKVCGQLEGDSNELNKNLQENDEHCCYNTWVKKKKANQ
jgi:Predicted Fe-S oxidoreductases